MEVTIKYGPEFKRQFKRLAKKYHSLRTDYDDLLNDISDNPFLGDDLGGGVRKVRMAIASKGKGKSGGARILTLNLLIDTESMEVTLLTIYDKGEISNVTDEYIKYLLSNLQSGVKNVVTYLDFADLKSVGTPGGFCLVCPTRSEPTVTGRSGIENRWPKGKAKVMGLELLGLQPVWRHPPISLIQQKGPICHPVRRGI